MGRLHGTFEAWSVGPVSLGALLGRAESCLDLLIRSSSMRGGAG